MGPFDGNDVKKQGQLLALEMLAITALSLLPDRGRKLLDGAERTIETLHDEDLGSEAAAFRELVLEAAYETLARIRHSAGREAD